jgi:peroxiredoxin
MANKPRTSTIKLAASAAAVIILAAAVGFFVKNRRGAENPPPVQAVHTPPERSAPSEEPPAGNPGVETRADRSVGQVKSMRQITASARTWGPGYTSWYGKTSPDLTLTDINGNKHRLSDYRGRKVMLIFWATWCGPCRMEIPHLIDLRNTVGEEKLAMLAISNEPPELVKKFARDAKLNYAVFSTDTGRFPVPYNSVFSIPSSFFIDATGKIRLAAVGLLSLRETRDILRAL